MQMHLQAIASEWSESSQGGFSQDIRLAMERVSTHYEPRTWLAFLCAVAEGRSTDQVAADYQLTPVAVRQIRSRILRHLRRELATIRDA
jgi:DNA-directed RNA polymerase specialized sigma24 family protein